MGRVLGEDAARVARLGRLPIRQAGLDLVLLDSNRASLTTLASGNIDETIYQATVADSARLSVELAGSMGSAGRADFAGREGSCGVFPNSPSSGGKVLSYRRLP